MSEHPQRSAEEPKEDGEEQSLVLDCLDSSVGLPFASATPVDMSAFDQATGPPVIVAQGKPVDAKDGGLDEGTARQPKRQEEYGQRQKLTEELNKLQGEGKNRLRQVEILTQLARSYTPLPNEDGGNVGTAQNYFEEAIRTAKKPVSDGQKSLKDEVVLEIDHQVIKIPPADQPAFQGEGNLSNEVLLDLYKEASEFYLNNKTIPDDKHQLIVDRPKVVNCLNKAVEASEKLLNQHGKDYAEQHAQLLEQKGHVHQNFGNHRDNQEAMMAYQKANDVRDIHKLPETRESVLAMKACADIAKLEKRQGEDPLPYYLRAMRMAARLPDRESADFLSYVSSYVDALKKSPELSHYKGDHQKVVDALKEVVDLAENKYSKKDKHMLPILEKVAEIAVTDPQRPSPTMSKYAVGVLERIYSLQKDRSMEERSQTLAKLSSEQHSTGDDKAATATLDKLLKDAEDLYGKDDLRLIPILSQMVLPYRIMSKNEQSAKCLERIYELQSNPQANISSEERIDTLLQLSRIYLGRSEQGFQKNSNWFKDAVALGKQTYPKDDPRYEAFLQKAISYSKYSMRQQAAEMLGELYDLQTAQNKPIEQRLKTLQDTCQQYLEAHDIDKVTRVYGQIVDMVKDNKDLAGFLKLPDFMRSGVRYAGSELRYQAKVDDEAKAKLSDSLYQLGNTLRKAGNILAGYGSFNAALENYQGAVDCFGQCLTMGTAVKSDMLADILSMKDIAYNRLEPDPKDEDEDQAKRRREGEHWRIDNFEHAVDRLFRDADKLVEADKTSNDVQFLNVLDRMDKFYHDHYVERKLALQTQSLNLAKQLNRPLEEIAQKANSIAYNQHSHGDPDGAIKTIEGLVEYAKKATPGVPNATTMFAFKQLSYYQQNSEKRVGGFLVAENKKADDHLKQALKSKQDELSIAKQLKKPDSDIAAIVKEEAGLYRSLGDDKSALKSLEEALKLDKKGLLDGPLVDSLIYLYKQTKQDSKVEPLLRASIKADRERNPDATLSDSSIELADLLKKDGKPEKIKEAAQIVHEAKVRAMNVLEKMGKPTREQQDSYNFCQFELSRTLEWMAGYYESKNDLIRAKETYLHLTEIYSKMDRVAPEQVAKAWKQLVQTYRKLGKKEAADEIQRELEPVK